MNRVHTKHLRQVNKKCDHSESRLHPFKDTFTPVSSGYLVTSKVTEFFVIS